MNAIIRQPTIHYDPVPDAHSDAETELARHLVDLRVHALVMLASAALAAFTGVRLCDAVDTTVSVEMASLAMPCDILSLGALAVFIGIAGLCLFEAHRCWRKATITSAHAMIKPHKTVILDEIVPASRTASGPESVTGLYSRIRRLEPL